MKEGQLLLTVSLPNFNHSKYLKDRIASILDALPKNSELIIIDDASEDNSVKIIEDFSKKDQRIRFKVNNKNLGVISVLKKIITLARGKYISFHSADDILYPNFFTELLDLAKKFPGYSIYCSDFATLTPQNKLQIHPLIKNCEYPVAFSPEVLQKTLRKTNFWIPVHCSMIETDKIEKYGGFNSSFQFLCDWFLVHTIGLENGVVYLPKVISAIRTIEDSYSAKFNRDKKLYLSVLKSLFDHLRIHKNQKEIRNFIFSQMTRHLINRRSLSLCINYKYFLFFFFGILLRAKNKAKKKFSRLLFNAY